MSETELKDYLKIDKFALDDEIVKQASLFYRISELYVNAIALRDTIKEELAVIDAEIDQKVRHQLGDKCTEGKVKSLLIIDSDHQVATDRYLAAKAEAEKCLALKEAFHQRGYMLRDLVQLFVSNYYGIGSQPTPAEAQHKDSRRSGASPYRRTRSLSGI